jgi:hypothetical protein
MLESVVEQRSGQDFRMRAICTISVYSTVKFTYLYSLASNLPHIAVIS